MKSKGFTLIELLATITILSVILLITFVSMSSVIKNSKDNLHDNQISQLEKAAEYYNNKEGLKDKNICVSVADLIDKGYIKQDEIIDPKTGKPISGLVKIEYNGKKYSYEYEEKTCPYANYYMNLLEDNEETGLSIGDKYSYQVNDTDTFNFYVLSIEEDKVNLIMDRNICGTNDNNNGKSTAEGRTCLIAWYASSDDNSNGPVTAMEGLYNATKNWTNVPNMVLDYRDEGHIENSSYGYGKIETTEAGIKIIKKDGTTEVTRENNQTPVIPYDEGKSLKARLPKLEEVYTTGTDTTYCHNSDGSCPAWLTKGLAQYSTYYPDNEHIAGIYGYWTLSSNPGHSDYARSVYYNGYGNIGRYTSNASHNGLRAVITVSMSDLS